jgi:hypothetical protein
MPNAGSAIPPPMLAGFENAMDVAFSVVLNEMANQPTHLTGKGSLIVPFEGNLNATIISDTTTVSDPSNRHTVTVSRNGHDDFPVVLDTSNNEIVANKPLFLGSIAHAGVNDVISLDITIYGTPSPMLSSDNFTIFLTLLPIKKLTLVH